MKHAPLHKYRRANRGFASLPFGQPPAERNLYRVEHRIRREQVEMREAFAELGRKG